jgi:hypothetical protein
MLPEALATKVREAGGEALLLDARRGQALLNDVRHALPLVRQLKRIGFTRFIDYSARHLGSGADGVDEFEFLLVIRAPEHGHAALKLRWRYPPSVEPPQPMHPRVEPAPPPGQESPPEGTADEDDELARLGVRRFEIGPPEEETEPDAASGNGQLAEPEAATAPLREIVPTPSLSVVYPAAAVAEREIWELLGIEFSGHGGLEPLLLDAQFAGHPLRRDFTPPSRDNYAAGLLAGREREALLSQLTQLEPTAAAEEEEV